jgi:bile acid:Na+ symporter, BASS family
MVGFLSSVFSPLVFITVALTALGIGLVTSASMLRAAVRRPAFAIIVIANVAIVPLVGYLIASALPLSPDTETGVILCAICAAGPLGLKASQISRSDMAWSLSLTVTLLVLNVIALPVWSRLLLDRSVTLRPGDLFAVLAVAIVGPMWAGGILGRLRPQSAERWAGRLYVISNVTLGLAVVIGVAANSSQLLGSVSSLALVAVVLIVAVSSMIGWAVRDDLSRRRASTFATMNRATSVALLVVGRAFPDQAEVFIAVVVYGVAQTLIAVGLSLNWGRRAVLAGSGAAAQPGLTG